MKPSLRKLHRKLVAVKARLVSVWEGGSDSLSPPQFSHGDSLSPPQFPHSDSLSPPQFPHGDDDLRLAALGLYRIQSVEDIDLSDLARGQLRPHLPASPHSLSWQAGDRQSDISSRNDSISNINSFRNSFDL